MWITREIKFLDILIASLWALIAWMVWSIIIIIITFLFWNVIDIKTSFWTSVWIWKTQTMFPMILSLLTFVWTSISMFLTYFLLNLISPDRYKKNLIIFWQISFFSLLVYIFFTPVYIYLWLKSYQNIMYIFLFHTLILTFWVSIILEIMNNYKRILIWIYWSFIWLFFSSIFVILIFSSLSNWYAKLISLVVLLPIINFSTTFFKQLFEFIYLKYNNWTNLDPIWDIFYRLEMEEKEIAKEREEKNLI